ncbi:MAG: phosphotransferase [Acidobacteriota bacterium]
MNEPLKLPTISNLAEYESCFHDDVWKMVAAEICRQNGISFVGLRRSPGGENIVFLVDESFVIKIFAPFRNRCSREVSALTLAQGRSPIKTPILICSGEIDGWSYLITTQLTDSALQVSWDSVAKRDQVEIVSKLGVAMKQLHSWEVELTGTKSGNHFVWSAFLERQVRFSLHPQRVQGVNQHWVETLFGYLATNLSQLPKDPKCVLLHGDIHPGNFLLKVEQGQWKIAGLIDFGDSLSGFHEYDFVRPAMHMAFGNRKLQRTLLLAYGYEEKELNLTLRRRLMLLTILHEGSHLQDVTQRLGSKAHHLSLEELEAKIWCFV